MYFDNIITKSKFIYFYSLLILTFKEIVGYLINFDLNLFEGLDLLYS